EEVVVADGRRSGEGGVQFALAKCLQHLVFESERYRLQSLFAYFHARQGTDDCPDPLLLLEIAKALDARHARPQRYRYAARHVRSGKPQMRVLGGFAIDDRVEQDITVDARHVKRKNDPADLQRHAELFRERFAEFELKSARLAIFA